VAYCFIATAHVHGSGDQLLRFIINIDVVTSKVKIAVNPVGPGIFKVPVPHMIKVNMSI
jgi:hypothetical protein